MFISLITTDTIVRAYLENLISMMFYTLIEDPSSHRTMEISIISSSSNLKIKEKNTEDRYLIKPFHYSEMIRQIENLKNNYFEIIGPIKYYPASGYLEMEEKSIWLSETQNKILSSLVCYIKGIEKKILYRNIWPRDIDISENKIDTHLTNLRNIVLKFSKYNLNFSSSRGLIRLVV